MKKITFLFVFVFGFSVQAQNYNFIKLNEPYTELVNAISLNEGEIWDDPFYELTLPFNFTVNNVVFNTLNINDSYIVFGDENETSHIISPSGIDLIDRGNGGETSLSPLSYKIDGTTGNRIAKIEFKNCGSYEDFELTMSVNFQIWLYENTNIIELRYGENTITSAAIFYNEDSGGLITVFELDNDTQEPLAGGLYLEGPASNPIIGSELTAIDGTPENTTVFRFTPITLSNVDFNFNQFVMFPNPANDVLHIQTQETNINYNIQDLTGKIIQSGNLKSLQNKIDISGLQVGLYFVDLDKHTTQKFIKK
jgi:hypothetical protein